jgi:hypothetical protein
MKRRFLRNSTRTLFVVGTLATVLARVWRPANAFALQCQSPRATGDAEQARPSLDFEVYRSRIEPIFLKKRKGSVRCYDCHSILATRLRLQPWLLRKFIVDRGAIAPQLQHCFKFGHNGRDNSA